MRKIGIDIGTKYIRYAVYENDFRCLENWKRETCNVSEPKAFYDYIFDQLDLTDIFQVGACISGFVSESGNVKFVHSENCQVLMQSNINQELFNRSCFRVDTINDVRATALYELTFGQLRNMSSALVFVIDREVGCCLVLDGEIIEGYNSFAGDITYSVASDGEKIVQVGNQASMSGLIHTYNNLGTNKCEEVSLIFEEYRQNESQAQLAVTRWILSVVSQMLNASFLYNPEVICLGGCIIKEKDMIELIREEFQKNVVKLKLENQITSKIIVGNDDEYTNCLGAVLKSEEY